MLRSSFLIWFISFGSYLVRAATTVSPTEDDDGFDMNLIYIIVGAVALLIIVIVIILFVSYWQNKHSPPRRQGRVAPNQHDGVYTLRPGQDNRAFYDLSRLSDRSIGSASQKEKWWEIPGKNLKIFSDNILGSGQYGIVLLGEITKNHEDKKCAVKTLKEHATTGERKSLKNELENMSGMDPHPNIVNLIGAQTLYDNFFVVVEYCENGSLYDFLRKNRKVQNNNGRREHGTTIKYATRLRIAFDITNGMNYLATKKFVHRDLAARNVLLDGELRAKIADFGRTRDINKMFLSGFESMRLKNEPIPTRWMPVETLLHQVFTSQSDVWSYGVLLWEIESGGVRPYDSEQTYHQVVDRVIRQGFRLTKPDNCPDVMYRIMKECWNDEAKKRPTFGELAEIVGNLLKGIIATPPTSPTRQEAPIRFL